nr:NADH dehydrogenase subunit 9 [Actinophrys sol]
MNTLLLSLKELIPIKFLYTDLKNFLYLIINYKYLIIILKFFQNYQNLRFRVLSTISCTDFPELLNRFELTYILMSIDWPFIINIKMKVSEFINIDSSSFLYKSAVWLEREIWDMFGVYFSNNLDLRRILTDYGFPYHPLRKTFPLQGYMEVHFNLKVKNVYYIKILLSQAKPLKNLVTPWLNLI